MLNPAIIIISGINFSVHNDACKKRGLLDHTIWVFMNFSRKREYLNIQCIRLKQIKSVGWGLISPKSICCHLMPLLCICMYM